MKIHISEYKVIPEEQKTQLEGKFSFHFVILLVGISLNDVSSLVMNPVYSSFSVPRFPEQTLLFVKEYSSIQFDHYTQNSLHSYHYSIKYF